MSYFSDFFKKISLKKTTFDKYDDMLTEVAELDNGFTLTNSGLNHALIANRHLISRAKKEIHIFTPMKEFFHDGTYSGMSEWVPENVKINILSPTDVSNILLVHGKPPENVNISQAPQVFLDAVRKKFKCINHFIVVDGKAYRREYDPDYHFYMMSFNDSDKSKELTDLFNFRQISNGRTFWNSLYNT